MARLLEQYKQDITPRLIDKFGYKNIMQVPKIEKVIINVGVGEAIQNPKAMDGAVNDLMAISGQKPVITKAKKSIAGFKLREGMPIGCKVTLRGEQAFDGRGNYSLGIKEQTIFPEIDYDKIDKIRGLEVVIVTTAKTDEEARELLKSMGMPFR